MEREIPFRFEANFDASSFVSTSDPTLQIGRVRTFYKYLNRNGSFISDSFADKLAASAYGKPVVGTYDHEAQDFKGHEGPLEAKGYGFVLPNSLSWEDHLDNDGITRTYATFDVIVWAEYWEEAKQIFTKGQSMEIDRKSIQGEWKSVIFDNREEEAYVYSDGTMAGLCVLGDSHTPCFEGAAFFSIEDDSYKKFSLAIQKYFENGGKNAVENQEEVIVQEETPVVETTLAEATAEEELVEAPVEEEPVSVPAEPQPDYASLYSELQAQYNTLNESLATLRAQYEELAAVRDDLTAANEQLKQQNQQFTATIENNNNVISKYENEEKNRLIQQFTGRIPSDIMSQIEEAKDSMTIDQMKTRFACEYTSFSMARESNEEIRIPQVPQQEPSALAQILNKYKR